MYWFILVVFSILSQDWHDNSVMIAVCEWLAVFMVTLFHWTLRWELNNSVTFDITKENSYLTF